MRAFAAQSKLETVVVRPGILYGGDAQPFIARLQFPVPRGKGRRVIVGSRRSTLPLTHVDNACDAIALAAERGQSGAAYNVVDGAARQGEYLDLLAAHGVATVRPTFVPPFVLWPVAVGCEVIGKLARRNLPLTRYRLKRATESLSYDTTAARDALGWSPRVDLPSRRARHGQRRPDRTLTVAAPPASPPRPSRLAVIQVIEELREPHERQPDIAAPSRRNRQGRPAAAPRRIRAEPNLPRRHA